MSEASKLSKRSISAIGRVITGNPIDGGAAIAPYRTGPKIIEFFNELGFNDAYSWGGGSESRWSMAESRLESLNGRPELSKAVEQALEPGHFLQTEFDVNVAVEYVRKYIEHDGYTVVVSRGRSRIARLEGHTVDVQANLDPEVHASHEYICEQLEKCDRKLAEQDYDGAITNARSLVEAVFTDIERRLDAAAPSPDGDLPKLYKRVQKLLNLEPERPDLSESLKQVLRGLSSVIAGIAPIRNRMGDAHVRTYKPSRHHAKLAVNAAKTLLEFVYDTFEYQKERGVIKVVGALTPG